MPARAGTFVFVKRERKPPSSSRASRAGRYRTTVYTLLADEQGNRVISYGDYAVALLDELENAWHAGRRFGVAYGSAGQRARGAQRENAEGAGRVLRACHVSPRRGRCSMRIVCA